VVQYKSGSIQVFVEGEKRLSGSSWSFGHPTIALSDQSIPWCSGEFYKLLGRKQRQAILGVNRQSVSMGEVSGK
jgi:hypothetical protein